MDEWVRKFERMWRSERLVYKALDESEESKSFMHSVMSDPVVYGLSAPILQKPQTKARAGKMVSDLAQNTVIALLVCLPKEKDAARQPEPGSKEADEAKSRSPDVEAGEMLGYIALASRMEGSAMISLCFKPGAQNKGYGRETINFVLDWAFRYGNLHRVSIGSVAFNERALHLYRSIGFVEEGRQREAAYFDLRWHDMIELSMLVHEWNALRGLSE